MEHVVKTTVGGKDFSIKSGKIAKQASGSVIVQSGETIKPDSIYIIRGVENNIYNKEALRVVNLIPEWNVYYRFGEVHKMRWTLPIVFDEQKRKKYAR